MSEGNRGLLVLVTAMAVIFLILVYMVAVGAPSAAGLPLTFPEAPSDFLVVVMSLDLTSSDSGVSAVVRNISINPGYGPKVYHATGDWVVTVDLADGPPLQAGYMDPLEWEVETGTAGAPYESGTEETATWDLVVPLHLNGLPLAVRQIVLSVGGVPIAGAVANFGPDDAFAGFEPLTQSALTNMPTAEEPP